MGLKYNKGKLRHSLIVPEFEEKLAEVMDFGANKYVPWNWVDLSIDTVMDSLLRHVHEIKKGNLLDKESGCWHTAMATANLMMLDTIISWRMSERQKLLKMFFTLEEAQLWIDIDSSNIDYYTIIINRGSKYFRIDSSKVKENKDGLIKEEYLTEVVLQDLYNFDKYKPL